MADDRSSSASSKMRKTSDRVGREEKVGNVIEYEAQLPTGLCKTSLDRSNVNISGHTLNGLRPPDAV